MNNRHDLPSAPILFSLFLASGFCGLLYQIVWMRLAFASFGVITPILSVVISVFMLGLSIGSWLGGKFVGPLSARTGRSPIIFYAWTELLIGVGGIVVPRLFDWGSQLLLPLGEMDSASYLVYSACILGIAILPWCILMGATYPLMMGFVKESCPQNEDSFSFLYTGNVVGAMLGTVATAAILIEVFGFRNSLTFAAGVNFCIAAASFALGRRYAGVRAEPAKQETAATPGRATGASPMAVSLLFVTGFVSLAMEVVWTRAFTPVLRTTIYSFAALLAVYLFATAVGTTWYRRHLRKNLSWPIHGILGVLAVVSFLPILANDPRLPLVQWVHAGVVLLSIFPFCALLGYLTPMLVDRYSGGSPAAAGRGYAVNIVGSILGPLVAGYFLLPTMGVKQSLTLLAIPFVLYFLATGERARFQRPFFWIQSGLAVILAAASLFAVTSYEDGKYFTDRVIRRDHVATVTATGQAFNRRLLVNGIGMTFLTRITKNMVHVPLASLDRKPESALVIAFGMGTTFRSIAEWGIDVTAVELVPSVPDLFGYYFDDADEVANRPTTRIVVDDGRRYLKRHPERYDLITIDPPPPTEAAGSSLLYSREFIELLKERLTDDGILSHWFPGGEKRSLQAVLKSITDVFPHVEVYHSIDGWGFHILASVQPIDLVSAAEFRKRMPAAAMVDFMEWNKPAEQDAEAYYTDIVGRQIPVSEILPEDFEHAVTDNRPYTEYFFVRRLFHKLRGTHESMH